MKQATDSDMKRRLAEAQLKTDYIEMEHTLQKIPQEIVLRCSCKTRKEALDTCPRSARSKC